MDFSAFGRDYPVDYRWAWSRKDVGEFSDQIQTIPDFISGVYYLRKTPHLTDFDKTCQHILKH